MVLSFGLLMWLVEHPLSVGGLILFLYMVGSVLVGFRIRFVVGVFLFLTGVSGIIVAFLYVVALCPNPAFINVDRGVGYAQIFMLVGLISFVGPLVVIVVRRSIGMGTEVEGLSESLQWIRDPCICAGLANLIPFLGFLLFLCIVSVVMLCGQQKQCLGGHGMVLRKRSYI